MYLTLLYKEWEHVIYWLLQVISSLVVQDSEHESIELQTGLDGLKEEKERLLNSLVEAE